LSGDTIEEWQIGYSPESWDNTLNLLKRNNFNENEIFLAGLSVRRELAQAVKNLNNIPTNITSGFYDRFRGGLCFRLMI